MKINESFYLRQAVVALLEHQVEELQVVFFELGLQEARAALRLGLVGWMRGLERYLVDRCDRRDKRHGVRWTRDGREGRGQR
jgi:hypothetical protein